MERKRFYEKAVAAVAALVLSVAVPALTGCDDDDDRISVPSELQNAFENRYQNAQRLEWETEGNYYVADFWMDNLERSAWFTRQFQWVLTETDLPYAQLPAPVRSAHEASAYAAWKVDDVDMVERPDAETVYVIEVEQGEADVDLYYTADGILVKEYADGQGQHGGADYLPSGLSDAVKSFIADRYPAARIVEWDMERGYLEVDIIHDRRAKDVVFNADTYEWVSTSWDVPLSALPQAVKDALSAAYPDYRLDDADFVETPAGNYYNVELERGDRDLYVRVAEDGTLVQ